MRKTIFEREIKRINNQAKQLVTFVKRIATIIHSSKLISKLETNKQTPLDKVVPLLAH